MANLVRETVRFSGRVQGVGFRYTTKRAAGGFDVTGYVRNMDDGTVELVAEGTREVLTAFREKVEGQMGGNIRERQIDVTPATGEYSDFKVRY